MTHNILILQKWEQGLLNRCSTIIFISSKNIFVGYTSGLIPLMCLSKGASIKFISKKGQV